MAGADLFLKVDVSKIAWHMRYCFLFIQKTAVAGGITLKRHKDTM